MCEPGFKGKQCRLASGEMSDNLLSTQNVNPPARVRRILCKVMKTSSLQRFVCLCAALTVGAASPAVGRPVAFREAAPVELPELRAFVEGQQLGFLDDGRVVLGGAFTEVNGEDRAGLARLLATGEVDASFAPDPAFASAHAGRGPWLVAPDGRVYFVRVDEGQSPPAAALRRLDVSGALDESYELRAATDAGTQETPPIITALFPGAGGRMLVAGQFTSLGGVEKTNVAQLEPDGSVDASFTFGAAGSFERAIALPDGRWIVITAAYEEIGNVPQYARRACRLLEDGSVDPAFAAHVFPDSGPLYGAHAFALDAAGRLVFAEPASMTDVYRLRLARLLADGTRDETFAAELPLVSENLPGWVITIIWMPPRVWSLAPDDLGGVECIAHFVDETFGGVVHVDANGEVSGSKFADEEGRQVLWLRRDGNGAWWGEIRQTTSGRQALRVARFLAGGEVDETFEAEAVRPGMARRIAALSDGSVVVEGWFNEADGEYAPGLAVVDANGRVQEMDTLPWTSADLLSILEDESLLAISPPPPIFIYDEGRLAAPAASIEGGEPLLARIRPDGAVQPLLVSESEWLTPRGAWLDADENLLVFVPGGSNADLAVASDLVRIAPSGEVDASFRARAADGVSLELRDAVSGRGGVGAWALARRSSRDALHRLDETGLAVETIDLASSRAGPGTGGVRRIARGPDGVFVAGGFDVLNGAHSPGVARLTIDGRVDPRWGGWLGDGTFVSDIRILDNGLIEVAGALVTPAGDASIAWLRPDGLPELNIPGEALAPEPPRPAATASRDGAWLMRLETGAGVEPVRIQRWQSVEAPEIAIEAPRGRIQIGDTISLRVPWSGVPVSFQWLVNGAPVAGGETGIFSFIVSEAHDGAVFSARLGFEDGSNIFLSWRLVVDALPARLVNGSIRAFGARGADTLMVGFVVAGGGPGGLLARGLGPALADFGVPDPAEALATRLLGTDGVEVLAPEAYRVVRDQTGASHPDVIEAARSVGAFFPELGFQSGNDQMLHPALAPGRYHLQVEARAEEAEGTMLGEVFSAGDELSLRNFSGRARISAQSPLIGGFVVAGDRESRVLIRAIGPGLSGFVGDEAAVDPALTLHRGAATLAANDDWGSTPAERESIAEAAARAGAFPLEPGSADAALLVSLPPGVYTAVAISDVEAGDGLALLEIYVIE